MTERRKLKKELSLLRYRRKMLPMLIDCSNVYGDEYYSEKEYELIDVEINKLENKIASL